MESLGESLNNLSLCDKSGFPMKSLNNLPKSTLIKIIESGFALKHFKDGELRELSEDIVKDLDRREKERTEQVKQYLLDNLDLPFKDIVKDIIRVTYTFDGELKFEVYKNRRIVSMTLIPSDNETICNYYHSDLKILKDYLIMKENKQIIDCILNKF